MGARPPVSEKLLRPPGHSLSCQLEDLQDSYMTWSVAAFLASIVSVGSWTYAPHDMTSEIAWLAVFGIGAAICTVGAWRTLLKMKRVRMGLKGEQVMAEQLQPLCAKGYQIFHDVPGEGPWNVDHVAVGPAGVFVIETKTRTKKPGPRGEPDYRATFDGKAIRFPGFVDNKATEQAKRNAKWLAGWLSKATGERVSTEGIVALPGWMVDQSVREGEVKVLSGKQVSGIIAGGQARLSGKAIQQIAYQLEQKCRDVQF
jgi:hypothetical protein